MSMCLSNSQDDDYMSMCLSNSQNDDSMMTTSAVLKVVRASRDMPACGHGSMHMCLSKSQDDDSMIEQWRAKKRPLLALPC